MTSARVAQITVLAVDRDGEESPAAERAWAELIEFEDVASSVRMLHGRVDQTPGSDSLVDLVGWDEPGLVLVVEGDAVPGPRLLRRLLNRWSEQTAATPDLIVDARVLPVELAQPAESPDQPTDDSPDPQPSQDVEGAALRITGACTLLSVAAFQDVGEVWDQRLSDDTGARLVALAEGAGRTVVCEPSATVFRAVRVDEEGQPVEHREGSAEEPGAPGSWSGVDLHPAALEATSLHAVLASVGMQWPRDDGVQDAEDQPFLSIVSRTQGTRGQCLEDMLTCLAGQRNRDFEVLLVCHRVTEEALRGTSEIVAALPGWLRERVQVVQVERPGRAAPLNEGFALARGRYVAILDDDDTVFAHWVDTFAELERRAAGRLLRTVALRQDVVPLQDQRRLCPVPVGRAFRGWPLTFEMVDHLSVNHTPCMTVAFPRGVFHDLGLRFDETLDTTEDWDFLVRTAGIVGVESAPEVTSVYRWWLGQQTSREVHSEAQWAEFHRRVQAGFDERTLLLQPGAGKRLREAIEEGEEARKLRPALQGVSQALETTREAHDRAVANWQSAEARAKRANDKLERRTARFEERLRLLREAHELLTPGAASSPGPSMFERSVKELGQLVVELRAGGERRSSRWFRR